FIDEGFFIPIERAQFDEAIREEVEKISASAQQCLREAGVSNKAIDLVILTGGSTEVHSIQAEFKRLFPNAAIADENKLSSVGLGLAYDSRNKFGKPVVV
ncbi:MAG: Hsp70 family protein, partial [Cytophagaceae bacterium]